MSFATPEKASKIYRKYISSPSTDPLIGKIYYKYLKTIVKPYSYFKYDRKNLAPQKPLQIQYIPTDKIKKTKKNPDFHSFLPTVKGGEWDQDQIKIEKTKKLQSFKQHFKEGLSWEKTQFYQETKQKLNQRNSQYSRNSNREIDEIMSDIDQLYKSIKENGFKEQKNIKNPTSVNKTIDNYLNEFNEVKIMYSRNGKPLLSSGNHRTIIAKILDIEKTPVRIKARHKKWQEKRNQAVNNPEKLTKKQKQHPDIKNLIN